VVGVTLGSDRRRERDGRKEKEKGPSTLEVTSQLFNQLNLPRHKSPLLVRSWSGSEVAGGWDAGGARLIRAALRAQWMYASPQELPGSHMADSSETDRVLPSHSVTWMEGLNVACDCGAFNLQVGSEWT
jgi:hypothetical protein